MAFPDTLKFTFPVTPLPVTVTVTVSPTFAVDLENAITSPAASDFGANANNTIKLFHHDLRLLLFAVFHLD